MEILYKLTDTGKTQTWQVFAESDHYFTVSGLLEGKKIRSANKKCKPKNVGKKNETLPAQQAALEARALHNKKLKEGYTARIEDVVGSKNDLIAPMLAEDLEDITLLEYPLFVQYKYDGIRSCICHNQIDAVAYSRENRKQVSYPHITQLVTAKLVELCSIYGLFDERMMMLDGELYNHDYRYDFDRISSLVKKTKPTAEDLIQSSNLIHYYIYDISGGSILRDQLGYAERYKIIEEVVKSINNSAIKLAELFQAKNEDELKALFASAKEKGYEGLIIRKPNRGYEHRRSDALLRMKEMQRKEFEVVDIVEGKGNRAGMCGHVVIKLHEPTTDGRTTCKVDPIGGVAFYKRLLEDREELIGKMGTVEFQNYTPKKSIRFGKLHSIRDYE